MKKQQNVVIRSLRIKIEHDNKRIKDLNDLIVVESNSIEDLKVLTARGADYLSVIKDKQKGLLAYKTEINTLICDMKNDALLHNELILLSGSNDIINIDHPDVVVVGTAVDMNKINSSETKKQVGRKKRRKATEKELVRMRAKRALSDTIKQRDLLVSGNAPETEIKKINSVISSLEDSVLDAEIAVEQDNNVSLKSRTHQITETNPKGAGRPKKIEQVSDKEAKRQHDLNTKNKQRRKRTSKHKTLIASSSNYHK